jgi:exodeoxyribonuclease-3
VRIVSWNVNSIRARLPRLKALLARWEPDVCCLQETKVGDEGFPAGELAGLGYGSASFGRPTFNGVAILTRGELTDIARSFPGDPVAAEARVIAGTVSGLRVVNLYAVNGKEVGDEAYAVKLAWFDALASWLGADVDPREPLLMVGDFNVAPADRDVHDPGRWRGRNLASEPERARIRALLDWGLIDLLREQVEGPGPFSFWDYRAGAFHRGWGLRIDLALGTAPVAARCRRVEIDREERKPTAGEGKPSDHAPVIVDLD